jgi:23S rRNA pseudouridine1911/1915/1917 synthase
MREHRLPHGLAIIHEDAELLVVDKPSGMLTVAAGGRDDRTAYWILCEYLRRKGEKRRVAVVHRLDRDTSGVLVFVKSALAKRTLMEDWNGSVARRRYIALAEGEFPYAEGTFDAPLGEDRGGRMVVAPGGAPAATHWRVLRSGGGYTLLELELETGRRNQIRAHLHWAERPVAGDAKYGARTDPIGRLALHAADIALAHPRDGRPVEFESPVPENFYRPLRGR